MKGFYLLIFNLLFYFSIADAQQLDWAKSIGGASFDWGYSIAVDDSGNVYTTGTFNGTVDFNPGSANYNLTSAGGFDVFLTKFNSTGNLLWAKSMGGANTDVALEIGIDFSGSVYVTGYFAGVADFDPGSGVLNLDASSTNYTDIFISKFDSYGNLIWAKGIGGINTDIAQSIALDSQGNVYTIGKFTGSVDFNPGPGLFILTATSNSDSDMFILKLDPNGNFILAKQIESISSAPSNLAIAVDDSANIYSCGTLSGIADFDPGMGVYNLTSAGSSDIFVSKLDAGGNFVWAKRMGGTGSEAATSIALDSYGNIYTTGLFNGNVDFDPGLGNYNLSSPIGEDIFISKLDVLGNFVWAKQIGSSLNNSEIGISIAIDDSNYVYSTGLFRGTADFDPGPGVFNLTAVPNALSYPDAFISKLDASGNFEWAVKMGGASDEGGYSVDIDFSGNVYATGRFSGGADFDPSAAVFNLISVSSDDIFILKLNQCENTYNVDSQTSCGNYTWIDGNTYTLSNNTATFTLQNSEGCDSIITLNLTVNPIPNAPFLSVINNCDSSSITASNLVGNLFWSNASIGNPIYVDSLITLHAVQSLNGCVSSVSNNVTASPLTASSAVNNIISCGSYTWLNGVTYYQSDSTSTYNMPNTVGCDSIITLNLTITEIDTSLVMNNNVLYTLQMGSGFQWLDCNNNYQPVIGQNNSTFTPTSSGSYAVIITQNSCVDTSACYSVILTNFPDKPSDEILIYPNPTKDKITIANATEMNVEIFNTLGQLIFTKINASSLEIISLEGASKGLYNVRVSKNEKIFNIKMVKN